MRKLRLLLVAVLVGSLCGCMGVQPETQAKINKLTATVEAIDGQIANLKKRHDAGELSTKEFIGSVTPLFQELAKAQGELKAAWETAEKEGSNKWGVGAMIAINLAAVIAGRVLGIPGLASGSNGNLLSLGKNILARGEGNGGG